MRLDSIKASWGEASKTEFIRRLLECGWEEIRPFLFERNGKRIEVDDYGIFLWEQNNGARVWERTCGLADTNINKYKRFMLKFKINNKLLSFMLVRAEWAYKSPMEEQNV